MDIAEVDSWIELLIGCKQLPENDVKKLCDKVITFLLGKRDTYGRIKRPIGQSPCYSLW
jgi:hypothetical protein